MKCQSCGQEIHGGAFEADFKDAINGVSIHWWFCDKACFIYWAQSYMESDSLRRVLKAVEG